MCKDAGVTFAKRKEKTIIANQAMFCKNQGERECGVFTLKTRSLRETCKQNFLGGRAVAAADERLRQEILMSRGFTLRVVISEIAKRMVHE